MSDTQPTAPRTLLDFLNRAGEFLAGKRIESARLDAEVLLADILGLDRLQLYTSYDRPLSGSEVDRYRERIRRRAAHEPVSYIIGRREFWSLDFAVDRRVLIPRPETETLVEAVLEKLREMELDSPRVADIGTGSGAIAVALTVEIPELRVVATDRSQASLEVAPLNARTHGVDTRIEFLAGDLLEPLADRGRFDVVVSNPPYVAEDEHVGLGHEVRDWEPRTALVAEEGGMSVTRALIEQAPEYLNDDGWLAVELGTQADKVLDCLQAGEWRDVSLRDDLAGHRRVAVARRPRARAGRGNGRAPASGPTSADG